MDTRIPMVDLAAQYRRLKPEIDTAILQVINSTAFINGAEVKQFTKNLAAYLQVPAVITCGNGTDALQIALMALNLKPGDEVIVPAFTYVAAEETVAMLGLVPVLVDVDPVTFNIDVTQIEQSFTSQTKAIIPVHLFGQCCDMEPIIKIAKKYHIHVIEDNAQSLGADYRFADGTIKKAGTIGQIGTTSFFPSKPLGCYGDGGALITSDEELGNRLRKIANHGQASKYDHQLIGCNSRLDTIQAAILNVKIKYMNEWTKSRQQVAEIYNVALEECDGLILPHKMPYSTHIYHQYTVRVRDGRRDELRNWLRERGIPSMVYYPHPMHTQKAFKGITRIAAKLHVAEQLCNEVLSLPICPELRKEAQALVIREIKTFFKKA